jgi:hypothetical protein
MIIIKVAITSAMQTATLPISICVMCI